MTKRDLHSVSISTWTLDQVKANSSWIFPQSMSLFAALPLVKTTSGLVSPRETLASWKNTMGGVTELSNWRKLWEVFASPRSSVLGEAQTKSSRWSEGVPLILSAFRELRGVDYHHWDWSDESMSALVGTKIWEAYSHHQSSLFSWNLEELLEFRGLGLRVRTGKKAGQDRTLTNYLPWGGVSDPNFKSLPTLTKYMVTQTWIYHPSVRHNLMICDWDNLDQLPPPLVHQDVLDTKQNTSKTYTTFEDIFNL